jgi:hypothetical protein
MKLYELPLLVLLIDGVLHLEGSAADEYRWLG